jgi:hypothetical protein
LIFLAALLGLFSAQRLLSEPQVATAALTIPGVSSPEVQVNRPLVRRFAIPDALEQEDLDPEQEAIEEAIEEAMSLALERIEKEGLEGGVLFVRVVDAFGRDVEDAALHMVGCQMDLQHDDDRLWEFGSFHAMGGRPFWLSLKPGACEVQASRSEGLLSVASPVEQTVIRSGEITRLRFRLDKERGGLGIQLGQAEEGIRIVGLFEDTPAWDADLQVGDVITRIDGVPTAEMSMEEFAKLGTGAIGEEVRLVVRRELDNLGVLMKGVLLEREYLAEDLSIGDGLHHWD